MTIIWDVDSHQTLSCLQIREATGTGTIRSRIHHYGGIVFDSTDGDVTQRTPVPPEQVQTNPPATTLSKPPPSKSLNLTLLLKLPHYSSWKPLKLVNLALCGTNTCSQVISLYTTMELTSMYAYFRFRGLPQYHIPNHLHQREMNILASATTVA